MQASTTLQLGDFVFERSEVPEKISFGGQHVLATHQLIGGKRIIDAMGRSDAPLSWSGIMLGVDALNRARFLDQLRVAGKPLALTWSELTYTVVIESFHADFLRDYRIPYTINCVVVEDLQQGVGLAAAESLDDAVNADLEESTAITSQIGDAKLSTHMDALNTATKAISGIAKATTAQVQTVFAPLAKAVLQVDLLIKTAANTVINLSTLDGLLPNNPIAKAVQKLVNGVANNKQTAKLYALKALLGRINANVGMVGKGTPEILTSGNLYRLAQKEYGDATAWAAIARANGLKDPMLTGVNALDIPRTPSRPLSA